MSSKGVAAEILATEYCANAGSEPAASKEDRMSVSGDKVEKEPYNL